MGMDKLWEIKQRIEQINQGKPSDGSGESCRPAPFEQRHRRITLYLENQVHAELQVLRRQGVSQSVVVNLALREFFKQHCSSTEP